MSFAQYVLDNSELLIKSDCKIVDGQLYEKCSLHESLFTGDEFKNTEHETYRLNNDNHVYRIFLDVDDYDYVTDAKLLEQLNKHFA